MEAKSVSKAQTSERKEPTTPVRIVERVSRPRETGAVPKTPAPPSATASKPASRPVPARAGRPDAVSNRPPVSEHVGGAREEWVDLSPRDRVGAGSDRGREERAPDTEDGRAGSARGTIPPRLVAGRDADYPISAMAAGVTGSVQLKIMVDPDGFVERAIVVRSSRDARLDTAAIRAALAWRYQPARRGGRAVAGFAPQRSIASTRIAGPGIDLPRRGVRGLNAKCLTLVSR